jgi:hypothetical protein
MRFAEKIKLKIQNMLISLVNFLMIFAIPLLVVGFWLLIPLIDFSFSQPNGDDPVIFLLFICEKTLQRLIILSLEF